ncbi:MAG: hypothetical protein CL672_04920 [Balneola sp.]|nr:hypothetical protein [Balneola sp.]|tara:strand:- start:696 stop:1304 length:609 start_codon:yes stop_codon:yes gene_type:complete
MEIEVVIHGLEIFVAILCFIALLPSSLNFKNLTKVYLLGSLLSFIISKIYILEGPSYLVRDVVAWGNFVSISLVLSALFVIIRDSKPVFARFPIYLTMLPLSGIIFFATIPTSYAIKDILELIMQAGAVLVALLLFCVNTILFEWKWTFLISILAFLCAYIIPIISFKNTENELLLGAIFLCLGMIFLTFSLIKYPINIEKS